MDSFWQFWTRIELWHTRHTGSRWLAPVRLSPYIAVLIVACGLVAGLMSWSVRDSQYEKFQQYDDLFLLDDGTALFTTTDASYFVGTAQALKRSGSARPFLHKRSYPEYVINPPTTEDDGIFDAPLLSVIIASFSEDASYQSLFKTAHAMIPITAFLTAVMIMIAFGAAGFWLEGAIAGAGGALSLAYLGRSSAGRIDTDQLNLGLLYLVTGLAIYAARTASLRMAVGLSVIAGCGMWIFRWWYDKAFLVWMVAGGLIWLSFVCHRQIGRTLLLAAIFIMVSGVWLSGFGVSSSYLVDRLNYGDFIFPNTFDTITEISAIPFQTILERISGDVWLALLSLAGLGLWGLRHPVLMVVFGPAAAFALLNFLVGNRAVFYSAPMLWFGFGWLVMRFGILADLSKDRLLPHLPQLRHAGISLAMVISFTTVWLASPTDYLQRPTFSKQVINSFLSMAEPSADGDKILVSWWDYGYAANLFSGQNVVHDGGAQTSPATFLVAQALLEPSAEKASQTLKLLAATGYQRTLQIRYNDGSVTAEEQSRLADQQVYLLLTEDMSNWMGSISTIGFFDIRSGRPLTFNGSSVLRYEPFDCITSEGGLACNGNRFDGETGRYGSAQLAGIIYTEQGKVVSGKQFDNPTTPYFIQAETAAGIGQNLAVNKRLFVSVFNQMYHLGQVDERYFSLVYDDYPHARIFSLK